MRNQHASSPLGPIPAHWQLARLGDVTTKIGSGATPKGGESAYLPERTKHVLIRSQNVFDYRFQETGLAFISEKQAKDLSNAEVRRGDALLNITGDGITFGRVCQVPDYILPACVNQHVSIVRVDPSIIDPGYLVAYLAQPSIKAYIESFNAGGSRRAITKGHIESFEIPLPPLQEQKRIAALLTAIQDKIDLNLRMDKTLHDIQGAVFKSWCIDFDPVRAKSEGRSTGLASELETIFPSTFTESEKGAIPSGWRVEPLDEIAVFLNGLALQQFPPTGQDDIPVIKIAELRKQNTQGASHANSTVPDEYIVWDGDVLFSWSGSLEVVVWHGGKGALNQHLFKVSSSKYPKWFYYFWLQEWLPHFQSIAASKATTMGHIQRHHLHEAMVVVPSEALLVAADRIMEPLLERLVLNNLESRNLASLRDTLLPRLMSGQIELEDVNRAGKTDPVRDLFSDGVFS